MFNETEGQTILRRAKEAMQAASQKAADARRARWLTQKPPPSAPRKSTRNCSCKKSAAKSRGGRFERGVRPLALLVACLLAGCGVDAVSTAPTDNAQIKVERLFDHDGCTVYRFNDGGPRYFVKCRGGSTSTEWSESYPCGKSMCRRDVAVPGA